MISTKNPHKIEGESFRIIRAEIGDHSFSDDELTVAVRVIHATADFEFRDMLKFHPQAIDAGVTALGSGCPIVTDVRMVEVGISENILSRLGGTKTCDIRHAAVYREAQQAGETRSTMAIRRNARLISGGIVAWIQVSSATGIYLRKYHCRCLEVKAFSRALIQTFFNKKNLLIRNGREIRTFREVLADQSIRIFIGASLPR